VKPRWTTLFYCALSALVGVAWLAQKFEMSLLSWLNVQLVGMIGASIVAFFAMIRNVDQKWPAAVALVCAAPMGIATLQFLPNLGGLLQFIGGAGLLFIGGAIATIAVAIGILAMPAPPRREDPLARARVVE